MQNASAIIREPVLFGLLLSIAVHAAILHGHRIYTPAVPQMDLGRTVVHLTLVSAQTTQQAEPQPNQAPDISMAPTQQILDIPTPSMESTRDIPPADEPAKMDAAQEINEGVTAEAVAASAFHPTYPRISRRRGEEGMVTLSVQVLADGSAGQIDLLQSSGHHRLDDAAVRGARQTTFTPALLLGRAIDSTIELSYTFRLTND